MKANLITKNTLFGLGELFSGFVTERGKSGRYGSASDVVRAGRLLKEQETRLAALPAPIEGEESGPAAPFDFEAFIACKRAGDAPTG